MEVVITKDYVREVQRRIDNSANEVTIRIVDDPPAEANTQMEAASQHPQQSS